MLFSGVTLGEWNFFLLLSVQVDYLTLFLPFVGGALLSRHFSRHTSIGNFKRLAECWCDKPCGVQTATQNGAEASAPFWLAKGDQGACTPRLC
jgi:hypothetical protein